MVRLTAASWMFEPFGAVGAEAPLSLLSGTLFCNK